MVRKLKDSATSQMVAFWNKREDRRLVMQIAAVLATASHAPPPAKALADARKVVEWWRGRKS